MKAGTKTRLSSGIGVPHTCKKGIDMVRRLAYAQLGGVDAVTDRLQIEDQWGQGASGCVTPESFRVAAGGGATPMSVTVLPGRGVIYSDVPFNGSYHVTEDEEIIIDLQTASTTQFRRDAIIARARDQSLVAGDGDTGFSVDYVPGAFTLDGNPPLAALPDRCFLIADVLINPNASTPSLITDRRELVKPREYFYQITVIQNITVTVNVNQYITVNQYELPRWPWWARIGGCRMFHRCESTARVIAAGEAMLRSVLGIAPDDVQVAGVPFYNLMQTAGSFNYLATGEYELPPMERVFSQMQATQAGQASTSLVFDQQQSVSTHTVRVFEQPT
jgi:hypothetical protein